MDKLENLVKLYGTDTEKNPDNVSLDKKYIIAGEKAAKEFAYGDIISKTWLLNEFSIHYPEYGSQKDFNNISFEFLQNMEGFKTYLLEDHKMYLVNVRGSGYKIMLPAHQSDFAMVEFRTTISNGIKKAVDTLTHINESMLTQDEIRRRDEHQGKIAAVAAFSKSRITKK